MVTGSHNLSRLENIVNEKINYFPITVNQDYSGPLLRGSTNTSVIKYVIYDQIIIDDQILYVNKSGLVAFRKLLKKSVFMLALLKRFISCQNKKRKEKS